MADKITFSKTLNTSVQIGDELFYTNISTGTPVPADPISLGTIIDKGEKWVKVDTPIPVGQTNPDLITNGGFDFNEPSIFLDEFDQGNISNWSFLGSATGNNAYHAASDPFGTGMDSTNTYTLDGSDRMFIDDIGSGSVKKNLPVVVGKTYEISFDYENIGNNPGSLSHTGLAGPSTHQIPVPVGTGTQTLKFVCNNTTQMQVRFRGNYLFPTTLSVFYYIDNFSVKEIEPAYNWYTDGTWDIVGEGKAIKTPYVCSIQPGVYTSQTTCQNFGGSWDPTGAGYLNQDLIIDKVPGEEYTLTMDIVGGNPATGDIKIMNTQNPTINNGNVDVEISGTEGTATWIQGSVNTSAVNIYQDAGGDAEIDNIMLHMTSFDLATALGNTTPENLFFMFRKPEHNGYTNVSSLKGYYAEATFTNSSPNKQELFAVGSEITISSK